MTGTPTRVCHLIGSLGSGGRESLILDIIRSSEDEGVSHVLCCLDGEDAAASAFEELDVPVIDLGASSHVDLGALYRFARYLGRAEVDVLHLHGPKAQIPGRVFGRVANIAVILSTHHIVSRVHHPAINRLERLTRPLDTVSVAVSDGVRRELGGGEHVRTQTIHNGIDVETFDECLQNADPSMVPERYEFSSTDPVYLNVGRYTSDKRQRDLIDAMAEVVVDSPNSRLLIVGGRGELEGELREAVHRNDLDDNVFVTGRVPTIHEYYISADAFVSSSVNEGLPIVLLEAMTARLPVLATDIPGVNEAVEDGRNGLLVSPRSPDELATGMLKLQDEEYRKSLGEQGRRRVVEQFHIDQTTESYMSLYKEAYTHSSHGDGR